MKGRYSNEELAAVLKRAIQTSDEFNSSKLAKERRLVLEHFRGEQPKPFHAGDSKYVSMDVYEGVDSMRSTILETFSANQRIVYFKPENGEDAQAAKIATDYASYVMFRDNDAEGMMYDVLTDGLMYRFGIAKVYLEEHTEVEDEEFSGLTEEEYSIYLGTLTDEDEVEVEQDGQTYFGTTTKTQTTKRIRVEALPSEDFLIAPEAVSIDDAQWCAHRSRKSKSTLIKMGFDPEQIDKLGRFTSDSLHSDYERQVRFEPVEAGVFNADEYSDEATEIEVLEIYIDIDLDGSGVAKLWKITMAGDEILDKERVPRKPFAIFTPLPVPHTFFGDSYAKLMIPAQLARTVLFRQVINHSVATNNSRYKVLNGSLVNPPELMDQRLGGIVNVRRMDAVAPLDQLPLNPFVFEVLRMLDEDKEETTGISKLSQGLNKDAISSQNSQGMVEQLISASQQRQKIIARQFGKFLRRVFLMIYDIAIDSIEQQEIVDVAGEWVEVNPATWKARKDASVELSLGYGEMEREAMRYVEIDQYLSQDQRLARMYDDTKRYEVLSRALRKRGVEDVATILTPPQNLPPPEPSPAEQLQMAQLQAQVELTKAQAQAAILKAQTDQMNAQRDLMKVKAELGVDAAELRLEHARFDHERSMDIIEAKLAKETDEAQRKVNIAMDG